MEESGGARGDFTRASVAKQRQTRARWLSGGEVSFESPAKPTFGFLCFTGGSWDHVLRSTFRDFNSGLKASSMQPIGRKPVIEGQRMKQSMK